MKRHDRGARRLLAGLALLAAGAAAARAEDRFYAYNMTTSTDFKGVYLAPAGTQRWSPNQVLNDKDHTLNTSERLTLTGLRRGRFDVRLQDAQGHTCLKRGVDLTKETTFDIRDADLSGCQ